jgi:hypothetical protein
MSARSSLNQPDWSHVGDGAHFVQFYQDESTLIPLLGRFIGTALVTGDSALVVGSVVVRDGLASHLLNNGYDVEVARRQGRYTACDSRETLRRIVRAGWLDAVRFRETVGALLDEATAGGRRVAVFGDMVAQLWADGNHEAAIRLEELWNDIASQYGFSLCCAYPMSGFSDARHAAPFLKICSQHSHVFSPETSQRLGGAPVRLTSVR